MDSSTHAADQGLSRALRKIESEVRAGMLHGFFEMAVSCEVITNGKRRLIIRAGKSYQFVISEEELRMAG